MRILVVKYMALGQREHTQTHAKKKKKKKSCNAVATKGEYIKHERNYDAYLGYLTFLTQILPQTAISYLELAPLQPGCAVCLGTTKKLALLRINYLGCKLEACHQKLCLVPSCLFRKTRALLYGNLAPYPDLVRENASSVNSIEQVRCST